MRPNSNCYPCNVCGFMSNNICGLCNITLPDFFAYRVDMVLAAQFDDGKGQEQVVA